MNDVKLPVPGPISNIILFSIAVTFTIFSKIFLSDKKFKQNYLIAWNVDGMRIRRHSIKTTFN